MTTLEAVREELLGAAAVTSLVGERIYPVVAKQGDALPLIVLRVVSEEPQNTLTGAPGTRLLQARVQVDCYAKTYLGAHALGDAVDAALAGVARVDLSISRESMDDVFDDETEEHSVSIDFIAWRHG